MDTTMNVYHHELVHRDVILKGEFLLQWNLGICGPLRVSVPATAHVENMVK